MRVTTEVGALPLADMIKLVLAGDEILLTQGNRPVAKLVSVAEKLAAQNPVLDIPSISGHQVLTPNISQSDIAEEMFSRS